MICEVNVFQCCYDTKIAYHIIAVYIVLRCYKSLSKTVFPGPWKDVSQLIKKQRYQKNNIIVNKNNFKPQKASKTPCDLFWNEKCISWNKTSVDIKQKAIETFHIQVKSLSDHSCSLASKLGLLVD